MATFIFVAVGLIIAFEVMEALLYRTPEPSNKEDVVGDAFFD